jgi:hypothetical protein
MAQSAIATEVHQPLDIHRDLPTQVALDRVIPIDQLTDAQHVIVSQLMDTPLGRNANCAADLKGLGSADPMDVSESDRDPLLIGDVDTRDARHLRLSSKVTK